MEKYDYYIIGTEFTNTPQQSLFDWIADSSNLLISAQLIAAFVTAGATIALFLITKVLAAETKTLAKMTAQPFVVCSLRSSPVKPTILNLVIQNTGNAVAFDIKVTINPALPSPKGKRDPDIKQTVELISMLPPGLEIPRTGVQSEHVFKETYNVHLEWKTLPGAKEAQTLTYAFIPEDGMQGGWKSNGLHDLVSKVEILGNIIKYK